MLEHSSLFAAGVRDRDYGEALARAAKRSSPTVSAAFGIRTQVARVRAIAPDPTDGAPTGRPYSESVVWSEMQYSFPTLRLIPLRQLPGRLRVRLGVAQAQ
jgi:hypothetical protein